MIPKIIHYCWFGPKELPEKDRKYMETWKKFLPDYELKLWNESNFDIDMFPYVRQAYDKKKFAFVSDVARLYALVNEGGIYMDTDVEILKPLDNVLNHKAVLGFEIGKRIMTAFMATEPGNPIFESLLNLYASEQFIKQDGTIDITTNVQRTTPFFESRGLKTDDSFQIIDDIAIYPSEYFCPYNYDTHEEKITENTLCYHHFAGTWYVGKAKIKHNIYEFLGPRVMQTILSVKRSLLSAISVRK